MNKKQQENTSKLLYDLVRFAVVGIILVNFVPGKEVSWASILAGFTIAAVAYALAYHLDSREG
jgi:hypothetical protein